ncbi:adenylate/guanylate cyclase domain-containing protein [Chloroflexota bacterium]
MSGEIIRPVKYIFLDVVGYSKRPVEAQSDIITKLNEIVRASIDEYVEHSKTSFDYTIEGIDPSFPSFICLPTGDGICVALLETVTLPFDSHLLIAKKILELIVQYNQSETDELRKFSVRIGINQSEDNIIEDYNGNLNVTGAGINVARRIMDLADGDQVLMSYPVYTVLSAREKYFKNVFRKFPEVEVKHGLKLDVYQLIEQNAPGLNVYPPSYFRGEPEPKLTRLQAYYFAHSIKNKQFILQNRGPGQNNYALAVVLWCLAKDSLGEFESTVLEPYTKKMPKTEHDTINEQYKFFKELPFWVCADIYQLVTDFKLGWRLSKYFEDNQFTVVDSDGRSKMELEWTEIWEEFGLDE